MGDQDKGELNPVESTEEQELERKIINKLKFYLEESEELLDAGDFNEIKLTCKRTEEIHRLNNLVSNLQELKLELEIVTQRALDNGKTIRNLPTHRFWTKDRCFVRASKTQNSRKTKRSRKKD